jgi:hypothetical protein
MNKHNQAWLRFGFILPWTVSAGIILVWGLYRSPLDAFDDAFITYRYAQNLRDSLGLVYNPGEWVLGTTTPFFALLLGGIGLFVEDIALLGHWWAVVSWIAVAWGALAVLWQGNRRWAGIIACLLLAMLPILYATIGMETALLVALMLWTAWSWGNGRFLLTILLAAALILTRQDSALWLLLLGLESWRRSRTFPWREGVGVVLLTLPWFLFAWWRYGSPIPNSAQAKIGQQTAMPVTMPPFYEGLWQSFGQDLPVWMLVVLLFSLLLGLGVILKRAHQLWWLPVWTIAYTAVYTLLGVVSFTWYFVPPVTVLVMITAVGLGSLLGDDKWRLPQSRFSLLQNPVWLKGTGVILALLLISYQTLALWQQKDWGSRNHRYHAIGQWFAENTLPDASVATIEIGMIGYHSQRPIVDTMGLVSPGMTDHQSGWGETLVYALNTYQPDYALALPDTAWDGIIERWWFQDLYQPVTSIKSATIYKRQNHSVNYQVYGSAEYPAGFTLTGVQFSTQSLLPGGWLDLWLRTDVQQTQNADLRFTVYLIDTQTDERTAVTTATPFDGAYRSSIWQTGDQLSLPVRLAVPDDLPTGTYRLGVFVYDPITGQGLPTTTTLPDQYPEIKFGWLRNGQPEKKVTSDQPSQQIQAKWQYGIVLEEITLSVQGVDSADTLQLGLHWYAAQTPDRDLTVFVHLINEAEEIVAQLDQRPFAGRFPTPGWQPGENLTDQVVIQLPLGLPAGSYSLRIGLYDENGRLPLSDGSRDYLLLPDSVQINP